MRETSQGLITIRTESPQQITRVMRRPNPFLVMFVLPYLLVRRAFRFLFGNIRNYQIFHQAGMNSTYDYLGKLRVPELVRPWIDVRTRFAFEKAVATVVSGQTGRMFIDIGANMGYYTALLSKNFETILAFEPHPGNLEILRLMVATGRLRNVVVRNQAVSDMDGFTRLYIHRKRVEHSIERSGEGGESLVVRTVRLDSFVTDIIDLIKVDVEGAELKVVKGAERSMAEGRILRWVIEVDRPEDKPKLENHLVERDYSVKWLDNRHLFASSRALNVSS